MNTAERRYIERSLNKNRTPHPLAEGLVAVWVPSPSGGLVDVVRQFAAQQEENRRAKQADAN